MWPGPSCLVAAPGRVNLIGEHTDYNDGFVMPAAIDRHVVIAAAPRADRQVRLYAVDFQGQQRVQPGRHRAMTQAPALEQL